MTKYPSKKMLYNMKEFAVLTQEAVELAEKHNYKGMRKNIFIRRYIQLRRRGLSKDTIETMM